MHAEGRRQRYQLCRIYELRPAERADKNGGAASLVAAYQRGAWRAWRWAWGVGRGARHGPAEQVECQHVNQFESTNVKIRLAQPHAHGSSAWPGRAECGSIAHVRFNYCSRSGRGGANTKRKCKQFKKQHKLNTTQKLNELLYK